MQIVKQVLIALGLAGYGASIRLNAQTKTLLQTGSKNNYVVVQNRLPGNLGDCGCNMADCIGRPLISNNNLCLPDPYHYNVSHLSTIDARLEEANPTAQCTFSARRFKTEPWRNSFDALRHLQRCQSQTQVTCGTVDGCVWQPLTVEQKAKQGQYCNDDDRAVYPDECARLDEVEVIRTQLANSPVLTCVLGAVVASRRYGKTDSLAKDINSLGLTTKCTQHIRTFAKSKDTTDFGPAFDFNAQPIPHKREINVALMNVTYASIINDLYNKNAGMLPNLKAFRSETKVVDFLMNPNHPLKHALPGIPFNDAAKEMNEARGFWTETVLSTRGTLRLTVLKTNDRAHGLWEDNKDNQDPGCKALTSYECSMFKDDHGTPLCSWNGYQCQSNDKFLKQGPTHGTTQFQDGTDNLWLDPYTTTLSKYSQFVIHEAMKHGRGLGFVDPRNRTIVKVRAYIARIVDALGYWNHNKAGWTGKNNKGKTELYFDMVYVGPKDSFYQEASTEQWMWRKTDSQKSQTFSNKWEDM